MCALTLTDLSSVYHVSHPVTLVSFGKYQVFAQVTNDIITVTSNIKQYALPSKDNFTWKSSITSSIKIYIGKWHTDQLVYHMPVYGADILYLPNKKMVTV